MPYLYCYILLCSLYIISKKELFVVAYLVLFLFCALRGDGSGDYFIYKEYSKAITSWQSVLDFDFPMEIGYRVISYAVNIFNLDSQFVIIGMAFLSVTTFSFIIFKFSKSVFCACAIYYFYFMQFDMHASRTAIAGAFGLISLLYFNKGEKIISLLFFIASICFHKTAIILLFVILTLVPQVFLYLTLLLVCFLQITVGFTSIIIFLLSLLPSDSYFYSKMMVYLSSTDFSYPMRIYDPRFLFPLLLITILTICLNQVRDNDNIFYLKIVTIGTILMVTFFDYTIIGLRLSYFFNIVLIILVPNIAFYFDQKILTSTSSNRLLETTTIICYGALVIVFAFGSDRVPYKLYY